MIRKIVLASGSPRRKSLLENYGFDITVVKPEFDEEAVTESEPEKLVCVLASGKNKCVNMPDETVLSADTVVALDDEILGKPKTRGEAYDMLKKLSGRTHTVYTGVCISRNNKRTVAVSRSDVTFYELTDAQINRYIDTGSPFDKAGGYGVQDDMGIGFVKSVTGELSNVIGLPMGMVISQLEDLK